MKRSMFVLAVALAMPAAAMAQTNVAVWRGHGDQSCADEAFGDAAYGDEAYRDEDVPPPGRWALRGGEAPFSDNDGLNAFFYPNGYDPQYGSDGRLADAADFADDYGCRPIWNAKYGRYTPACN